jgi:hypothetical protein
MLSGEATWREYAFFSMSFFMPFVASLIILFEEAGSLGWGGLERSLGQPYDNW